MSDQGFVVSFGHRDLGAVTPQTMGWEDLVALLTEPVPASIDHAAFIALPKPQRNALKKRDRFMLPGVCRDGRRDDAHLESRSAATLDIDDDAAGLYGALCFGCLDVPFAYAWHTTRSHTEDAPRLRIVVPFNRPVSADEYRRIVPVLGEGFGVAYDPASIKPSQMMYLPVRNAGAPFESGSSFGSGFVDVDKLLLSAPIDERQTEARAQIKDGGANFSKLISALTAIGSNEREREQWRNIVYAIHHETSGSPAGLEIARWWAGLWDQYDVATDETDDLWEGAGKRDGAVVTAGTIYAAARRHGWQDPDHQASDDDFDALPVDTRDAPKGWHDGWYFLAARDRLAKVGEPGTLSITGFNTRFSVQMSANSKGKKEAAFEAVRNGPGFPIAEDVVYAAGQPPVYMFEGRRFVNAYRESSIPPAATNESPGGREAVARVRRHLELLCGDADTARMVETWIALNVREPGRLIGVALLVKGVQGDGKTIIFSQLMSEIMGRENVGLIANKEMSSDFSGWATGRAVRVVEELKAPGHNRHDMLNSIKPNITNPTVRVVRKGQDGFDALNTTNYACLTNHEDALPLDETDRRWWVIFSPFTDIAQLRALVGDLPTYFDALSKAIAHHGPELRKYFLECSLDARVHHHMRAPATEGRARMIQAENQLAGGDYLDGYIASGGECGISADIVASSELRRCLLRDMEEGVPHTTKLKRLLESRGYRQCVGTIKWVGAMHRVYVRDSRLVNAAADEVGRQRLRSMLDETVKNNQLAESSDFEVASK
ncbi:DUF5906 domain-containing protein [Burkholderia gladioli]|uniref:DUF5906 domain-containing protein n=1 Tax=Burkholderia gladioli TaxID=28095 RepID=UPI0034DB120B